MEMIDIFLNPKVLREVAPLLANGLLVTLKLMLLVVPIGLIVGLAVALLHRGIADRLRVVLEIYIDLIRAFPPLVLIILVFYGLPFVGAKLGETSSVVLALVLVASGYYGEIFRAAIGSVG